ncbi:hypothetical protein BD414DRAFT_532056 [Trametes punicea]|nr:hypothetical protein BD414DRAFT_532056 [Trametes punicea]
MQPDARHTRRRRVSISGKLLGLFVSKPKATSSTPPRPVISHPQPLERRAVPARDTRMNASAYAQAGVTHRKRDCREASLDENENERASCTRGDDSDRRAASRPRLDSDLSDRRTMTPMCHVHPVPLAVGSSARPLKSALKKSASESDGPACSSGAPAVLKGPLSSRFSHGRAKGTLKGTTQHNRDSSSPSFALASPAKGGKENNDGRKAVGFALFRSLSPKPAIDATAAERRPRTTLKKTVTFADELTQDGMVTLKRSWTSDDVSSLAATSNVNSTPATPLPSIAVAGWRDPESPRRKSDSILRVPAKPTRAHRALPLPPPLTASHANALPGPARAVFEKQKEAEGRAHDELRVRLARQVPPNPEAALKRAPFRLSPVSPSQGTDASTRRSNAGQGKGVATKELLDEGLREIARDKEEGKRGSDGSKPVAMPTKHDVLRRFKAHIIPDERHSTIWDGNETAIYAWSGTLVVHDSKPASYFYPRHAIHDFSIQFHTVGEPRSDPHTFDPTPSQTKYEWQATYTGHRISAPRKGSSGIPTLDPAHGIVVENEVRLLPDDPDGPCRWQVRFWVPVPLSLFVRAEHRTFVCRAKVTVRDWETPKTEIPAGCIAIGIEHLSSGRLLAVPRVL